MTWNGKNGRISEDAPVKPVEVKPVEGKEPGKGEQPGSGVVQFIDVSRYQPNMHWGKVREAGFEAVVAKAQDGESSPDPMFSTHMRNAYAAGLVRGAYCFNRFSADPVTQANFFAKNLSYTRWLIADIEWDKSKTTEAKFGKRYGEGKTMDDAAADHALKFLERLEALGFHPWIYSNTYFFLGFKNPERFARFPYWASNYTQKAKAVKDLDVTKVPLPKPFKKPIAWQWTDKHPAAKAVTGDLGLDANVFYGSIDELKRLAGQ